MTFKQFFTTQLAVDQKYKIRTLLYLRLEYREVKTSCKNIDKSALALCVISSVWSQGHQVIFDSENCKPGS
jgi:hypothetical protein